MRGQRGAVLALVLAIVVMLMVAGAATYALSRLTGAREDTGDVSKRLEAAAAALEQFAGTAQRLPCPANPAVDDGVEVQASAATCTYPEGTVPWRTIGMRRDDSYDPWGRKISYRVYTGNKGSFTQPGGISMVECDTVEPSAGAVTPVAANAGGLCVSNTNPQLRSTSAAAFLAGKGLAVVDNGTARIAAFVLVSHGVTGLGGYTVSGARLGDPSNASPERENMRDTGPFTAKAFSNVEEKATGNDHFDDFVVYRTIDDLVKKVGLAARDWPEPAAVLPNVTFDAPTIATATGSTPAAGASLGATSLTFNGTVVTASNAAYDANPSSTTPPTLAYEVDSLSAQGGLGVYGGSNSQISSATGEYIRIALPAPAAKFGVTLNQFDSLFGILERVQFRFYQGATLISTLQKSACHDSADNMLTSYSFDVGSFDSVEVRPVASTVALIPTSLSLASIVACTSSSPSCRTALAIAAVPAGSTEDCP